MNWTFSIILSAFVMVISGVPTFSASLDASQISEITLERTRCLGPCPAYQVVLRRDGTATYIGKAHVERLGAHQGKLHPSLFIQLARLLLAEDFFELQDRYFKPVTDSPSAIITVVRDGQRKRVSNYASTGPIRLWGLEMAIDAVAAYIEWEHHIE